jgi:hypothetical protein
MRNISFSLFVGGTLAFAPLSHGSDLLDRLGLGNNKSANPPAASGIGGALTQDQMAGGLKEALASGVQHAVANLGKSDGFLKDAQVKIPLPDSLKKVEAVLRAAGQGGLADEFITTMNRAAEQAVPEGAAVLGDAVKQMSLADAETILTSTNTAATEYFRRTSDTKLQARFLPIVKAATEKAGVTGAYKRMTEKAAGGTSGYLGGLTGGFLNKESLDIDSYVTRHALDGLFVKIAEQEKLIRENPVARTTDLLQKVFGAVGK